jgi:hypothetical protein
MAYVPTELHLTESQRKSISAAAASGEGVRLKFTYRQLEMPENHKILLTKTQHAKLAKSYSGKKGLTITLSKKQMQSMKTAGFLPALLVGLASALAPTIFGRIFPQSQEGSGVEEVEGSGIVLPNGEGLVLPGGSGLVMPDGSGIFLPGAKFTRRNVNNNDRAIQGGNGESITYRGSTSFLPDSSTNVHMSGTPKKKAPMAAGFVAPGSESFQELQ